MFHNTYQPDFLISSFYRGTTVAQASGPTCEPELTGHVFVQVGVEVIHGESWGESPWKIMKQILWAMKIRVKHN